MLPQFTCPECGNHNINLTSYVMCEQAVQIGLHNIRYEVSEIDYDDMMTNYTNYYCSDCDRVLTTEHGEEITTEEELKTHLHNQHILNSEE